MPVAWPFLPGIYNLPSFMEKTFLRLSSDVTGSHVFELGCVIGHVKLWFL
jgi:hypothetical protein